MRVRLSVPIFLAALAVPAAAADRITVEAIQVRLLYEKTGKLSKDIAPPGGFSGHNTIIGEGDAEEPANDVLVTVVLAAPGEANGEQKLVVSVRRGKDKKEIARRTIEAPFIGTGGKAYRSLLVQDATCDDLEVTAAYGKSRKQVKVPFACGE